MSSSKSKYTIALAGNPNVGKSTIFNNLTGMHQHTGNWPGKTVANATGTCSYKNNDFLFVDIPGTYSIMSNSEEEEIARDYICFGNPDATVVVVDATCLERNLNLVFQIMEITDNVIVCVNLLDEAKKKKIDINLKELSKLLGVPVVGTIARKKHSLNCLLETVLSVCKNNDLCHPKKVRYSSIVENSISQLETSLKNIFPSYFVCENMRYSAETSCNNPISESLSRWISLKVLDGEPTILQSIENHFGISLLNNNEIDKNRNKIFKTLSSQETPITKANLKDHIVSSIMAQAERICKKVCTFSNPDYSRKR